jgi:DNA-binding transcriptional regulator of glucitol operon
MEPVLLILGAVVAGWMVQLWLTYKQSMAFNDEVRAMRPYGTVSVGVGGTRYRGGRAFVAIAVDDGGVVRQAITLRGWTTFARARPLPALVGVRARQIKGTTEIPGLARQQREAARQAAELLEKKGSPSPTDAHV